MALSKYKLGELIQLEDERNAKEKFSLDDVKGISIQKIFIETKADMEGVSLVPYILVKPDYFAYVTVTSRNGEKITLAHNDTNNTYIVSSSYVVFKISRPDILLSEYIFMYFNRSEFDRYARFNSWGSARETFSWEDMCNIDIELPPIEIQQKYVNIYKAMTANQKSYERGLEDLKLFCDGYIEDLRRKMPCEKIGKYIELIEERNEALKYGIDDVRGVSTQKIFINTKADMIGVSLKPYILVKPDSFVHVAVTSRQGDRVAIAHNETTNTYIVSSSYIVFKVSRKDLLDSNYLFMYFNRPEFDRYARYNSWGSVREIFTWEETCNVSIPIPDIEIQKSIANIYTVYQKRKAINEKLKSQIKNICPILIKSAMEEGK